MRTRLLTTLMTAVLMTALGSNLFAQKDSVYTLNPPDLIPSDSGYYISGADKVVSGVTVHYNGCYDAYGDGNFMENGLQQGYAYHKCMIMPTCIAKGTPTVPAGFIGIGKGKYFGTDSMVMCIIMSPLISSLDSMFVQTSSDVSINGGRTVPYFVEYSMDNGTTWNQDYWIEDHVAIQGGYTVTYKGGKGDLNFDQMVADSKTKNIRLRIRSGDNSNSSLGADKGQRVFVHNIKIYAHPSLSTGIGAIAVSGKDVITITNNTISAKQGTIAVYNQLGQLIGSGKTVNVPSGFYIVKSSLGVTQKIFITNNQ